MTPQDSAAREAFEAQMRTQFPTVNDELLFHRRKSDGSYSSLLVHHAWRAWQAARTPPSPAAQQPASTEFVEPESLDGMSCEEAYAIGFAAAKNDHATPEAPADDVMRPIEQHAPFTRDWLRFTFPLNDHDVDDLMRAMDAAILGDRQRTTPETPTNAGAVELPPFPELPPCDFEQQFDEDTDEVLFVSLPTWYRSTVLNYAQEYARAALSARAESQAAGTEKIVDYKDVNGEYLEPIYATPKVPK